MLKTFISYLLLFLIIFIPNIFLFAQQTEKNINQQITAGTIVAIQGIALFHRDGKDLVAQVGNDTFLSDTIITQEKSKVKIVLNDGNVFTVGASTQVTIESFLKPKDGGKHTSLALSFGRLWIKVKTKLNADDSFQVKTANAIAGVRGTHFSVGYNAQTKDSDVLVFDGTVAFGNEKGKQDVSGGHAGEAKNGEEPQSREMDSHEMEQSSQEGEVTILEDDSADKEILEQHIEKAANETSKENKKENSDSETESDEENSDNQEKDENSNDNDTSDDTSANNTNGSDANNMSQTPVNHDAAATYRRIIKIFGKVVFKNY